ncbi:hypothetical protein OAF87_02095 [Akkermansiaceae bacterium]|nr:hypothetical protein [Akkermansiaceae bacterium]
MPDYHVEYSKELFEHLNNELPCPPFNENNWSACLSWFKDSEPAQT